MFQHITRVGLLDKEDTTCYHWCAVCPTESKEFLCFLNENVSGLKVLTTAQIAFTLLPTA